MSDRRVAAFAGGSVIGILGGLIGLGGAEFRLPLLLGYFAFPPLKAVIINKALSLVVVASAFVFRAGTVPFEVVLGEWPVIINLLMGSLFGAWFGAGLATRMRADTLRRVIASLLMLMAILLFVSPDTTLQVRPAFDIPQMIVGVIAGVVIGVVAAFLGVAGGELLIPTLVILFGIPIGLAGSVSLAVSFPTMIVGFIRYSYNQSFSVLRKNRGVVVAMAIGSLVGTFIGGHLLGVVPHAVLIPLLAGILVMSAVKLVTHSRQATVQVN